MAEHDNAQHNISPITPHRLEKLAAGLNHLISMPSPLT
jgi:hypothetical protein